MRGEKRVESNADRYGIAGSFVDIISVVTAFSTWTGIFLPLDSSCDSPEFLRSVVLFKNLLCSCPLPHALPLPLIHTGRARRRRLGRSAAAQRL